MDKLVYTVNEVADILQTTRQKVMYYIHAGKLKAFKLGYWKISNAALNNFIAYMESGEGDF